MITKANQIREEFINFYKKHGHQPIPPAPIVPINDPTTLFTNSGMQQLVPYLKGEKHPMGKRLVDAQPCFRAEDIEEVGDNRHITFFEMLGNWSLGEYFKKEQLPWFFEFLTGNLGLDEKRLYVSVFEGNQIAARDEESISIWKNLFKTNKEPINGEKGFNQNIKIYMYNAKKNWWSRAGVPENMPMGEIGGTTSEVFYDFGAHYKYHEKSEFKNQPCHINCDCGRFLEIGNSVFMEYEKQEDGSFKTLPSQNVDFGGGLERIVAAVNNNPDIFKTDLFSSIIDNLEKFSGRKYQDKNSYSFRIICDHIRGITYMLAQGLLPSNKQQGYFLRRLIRRSVIQGENLGITDNFLSELIEPTLSILQPTYLADVKQTENMKKSLSDEETKFRLTLNKGKFKLHKILETKDKLTLKPRYISELAFDFFQTHGLPFEIFVELIKKEVSSIDLYINEVSTEFQKLKEKHASSSRTSSAGMFKGGLADKSIETTRLHTATHLLHKALRKILGSQVHQEGSHITARRLRFDFNYNQLLNKEQLKKIEAEVNSAIKNNYLVVRTIEAKERAVADGAMAFFKENYPDKVSVYTIKLKNRKDWYSKELCGGPHVKSTGEIGKFKIIKQESIGTNIKRIYANVTN
jgi:alanyl-tRNA synthetase